MGYLKSLLIATCLGFAATSHAGNTIKVTVKTDYKRTAALGFKVEGKEHGGLGKLYSSRGPKNKLYAFGLRIDSVFGDDLDCGTLVLNENTVVQLLVEQKHCRVEAIS